MTEIRPLDLSPSGIATTCRLLKVVYPHATHITPDYLDRLYNGNPLGKTFGYGAFSDGELIGHYLIIPIKSRIFGKAELGIWPFQLATHPGYRGKGLFTTFTEQSFRDSRERGYNYVLGVGNAMSSPLFVGKWGFQSIQLDARLGVGSIAPSRQADDEVELERIWDKPGIAWRIQHGPRPYRVKYRNGIGHLYAETGKFGIWAELGSWERQLLPDELSPLDGANPLRLWIGLDRSRRWSRSSYVPIPMRFRPSPLNLLFLDLTGQKRTFHAERVRYTLFDFDAY
jgi:GNAT superfamily N-acetyltransferase